MLSYEVYNKTFLTLLVTSRFIVSPIARSRGHPAEWHRRGRPAQHCGRDFCVFWSRRRLPNNSWYVTVPRAWCWLIPLFVIYGHYSSAKQSHLGQRFDLLVRCAEACNRLYSYPFHAMRCPSVRYRSFHCLWPRKSVFSKKRQPKFPSQNRRPLYQFWCSLPSNP